MTGRSAHRFQRGSVWWVDLGTPDGSGPGLRRPVVIISSDSFNRSRISTIVAAVVTSNLRLADAPGNVRLGDGEAGLPKPSVVNVSQLVTVDRTTLVEQSGSLAVERMMAVDRGLQRSLSL